MTEQQGGLIPPTATDLAAVLNIFKNISPGNLSTAEQQHLAALWMALGSNIDVMQWIANNFGLGAVAASVSERDGYSSFIDYRGAGAGESYVSTTGDHIPTKEVKAADGTIKWGNLGSDQRRVLAFGFDDDFDLPAANNFAVLGKDTSDVEFLRLNSAGNLQWNVYTPAEHSEMPANPHRVITPLNPPANRQISLNADGTGASHIDFVIPDLAANADPHRAVTQTTTATNTTNY